MTNLFSLPGCALFVFLALLDFSSGHICLFYPQQRGPFPYNIYYPFPIPECARHGEPCGGMAPEKPKRLFQGGKQAYVKWQQNVNNYEIGNPGYMEVSLGSAVNASVFDVLAIVQDQNTFTSFPRQNNSALVDVPNIDCAHCVLRVRYITHKPGDFVYVQCADITVTKSASPSDVVSNFPPVYTEYHELAKGIELQNNYPLRREYANGVSLYGFAHNPYDRGHIEFVKIDLLTGLKEGMAKFDFDLELNFEYSRSNLVEYSFVADAFSSLTDTNLITLLLHEGTDINVPPATILQVDPRNGNLARKQPITNIPKGQSFSALIAYGDGYLTFSIRKTQNNQHVFVVGKLTSFYSYGDLITTPQIDHGYLNFEWAEYNPDAQMLYVLVTQVNVTQYNYYYNLPRMYIFDIANGRFVSFHNVSMQYEHFAGRSFHYYKKTGKLYAVTGGYFGNYKYADYSLTEIDPANGNITQRIGITNNQVISSYAGGMIFNAVDQSRGIIYHVLRIADSDADVIAAVDIEKQKATFSKMTNLRHIHNLVLVPTG